MKGQLLTPEAAAARLGTSASDLARRRRTGDGPSWAQLTRTTVRYDPDVIDQWRQRCGRLDVQLARRADDALRRITAVSQSAVTAHAREVHAIAVNSDDLGMDVEISQRWAAVDELERIALEVEQLPLW